ncbi:hypothetical protein HW445_23595, partial [Streptomyces sp. UH6]|nr:hypothetical protein [Streptomyces sp. UH6]
NVKLRQVAEMILLWARTGDLPAEVRAALEEALRRHAPPGRPVTRPRFNAAGPGHSGH